MTFAIACVLIAGILPLACAGIAKWGFRDFDNRDPRGWLARQTGYRARANAAQANSFEAFPFFAAAVILALFTRVDAGTLAAVCATFILARIGFVACYVADKATLRSLCWLIGYGSVVALFVLALRAA